MNSNKRNLGQFFTPPKVASNMLGLRRNFGTVLEPAGGKGVFLRLLEKNAVAIEFDESLNTDPRLIVVDYFDYPTRTSLIR